ncbi:MAG TPA: DUF3332 domain-containing protein [Bacteroidales bacterium]|nr:DUF3332 domain-containing protein [Bacteroidales bacterium]
MKKLKIGLAIVMALGVGSLQTSCIGSFKLTNNLYNWNNSVGEKFVNEVVFLAMLIVPVYEVTLFIDGVILNTIEFWTGSNPIAMEEGASESQIVEQNGVAYEVTASQNRFDFVQLSGDNAGEAGALVFNPEENSWSYEGENESYKLVQLEDNDQAKVFFPNGASVKVSADSNGIAALKEMMNEELMVALK